MAYRVSELSVKFATHTRSGAGQPVFQQSYVFIDVCKDQQGRVQKQMTCQFAETTYEEKFDITDSATREFPFLPVNLQPADPSQPVTGMTLPHAPEPAYLFSAKLHHDLTIFLQLDPISLLTLEEVLSADYEGLWAVLTVSIPTMPRWQPSLTAINPAESSMLQATEAGLCLFRMNGMNHTRIQRIQRFCFTFSPVVLASVTALCTGLSNFAPAFYVVVVLVEGIQGLLAKIASTDSIAQDMFDKVSMYVKYLGPAFQAAEKSYAVWPTLELILVNFRTVLEDVESYLKQHACPAALQRFLHCNKRHAAAKLVQKKLQDFKCELEMAVQGITLSTSILVADLYQAHMNAAFTGRV